MNRRHRSWLVASVLLLVALLTDGVGWFPAAGVHPAVAGVLGPNAIIGFVRYVGAVDRRIRTYREGRATAQEVNVYYDQLLAESQRARQEMIARATAGDTHPTLARAYTRLDAALQAEREASIQMIEAEKNQARLDANRARRKAAESLLVASPGGQQIIGQIREAIGRTREVAVAVQIASNEGRPIQALGDALVSIEVAGVPYWILAANLEALLTRLQDMGQQVYAPQKRKQQVDFEPLRNIRDVTHEYVTTTRTAKAELSQPVEELLRSRHNGEDLQVQDRA